MSRVIIVDGYNIVLRSPHLRPGPDRFESTSSRVAPDPAPFRTLSGAPRCAVALLGP